MLVELRCAIRSFTFVRCCCAGLFVRLSSMPAVSSDIVQVSTRLLLAVRAFALLFCPGVAMALSERPWVGPGVIEASNCLRIKSIGNLFYPCDWPSFLKYLVHARAIYDLRKSTRTAESRRCLHNGAINIRGNGGDNVYTFLDLDFSHSVREI